MPPTHFIHPDTEKRDRIVPFDRAEEVFERDGVLPRAATRAILADIDTDKEPHPFVRPSDVTPDLTCRRQETWKRYVDYGLNPLEEWPMHEGTAVHDHLKTEEVEVPGDGERALVLGVPMRGRMDLADPTAITDYKTSSPYWYTKYGAKGSGQKPWVAIWEPPDDTPKWQIQLSIYNVLAQRAGHAPRARGVVWRLWRGVKQDQKAWQRFEFPLLTEAQLEEKVGPWVRLLAERLGQAYELWGRGEDLKGVLRETPPDGRKMVGKSGNLWKCLRCPFKVECEALDPGWVTF